MTKKAENSGKRRMSFPDVPLNEQREVTDENFGALLVQAAEEMVAIHQGEQAPARIVYPRETARNREVPAPPLYDATRVRQVREKLGVSQAVFARLMNVTDKTVQSWEQGVRPPSGAALRLLELAEIQPEVFNAVGSHAGE